jgi:hypothetical protein
VLRSLHRRAACSPLPVAVVPPTATKTGRRTISLIEDAAAQKERALVSATSPRVEDARCRFVTRRRVHRVVARRPARFIATCHRDDKETGGFASRTSCRRISTQRGLSSVRGESRDTFHRASVDGFNAGGAVMSCRSVVRGRRPMAGADQPPPDGEGQAAPERRSHPHVTVETMRSSGRAVCRGASAQLQRRSPALARAISHRGARRRRRYRSSAR